MIDYTKEELLVFEDDIRQHFLKGEIRYPVHFSQGNEDALIKVFKENNIGLNDWVFASHRNHYSALLKGIPKEWLKEQILKGNSMHIMSKEYKFFSSSIVGGSLPIAVGTAMACKGMNDLIYDGRDHERVFAFLGDMASTVGLFQECAMYSLLNNLPIKFIIEDNNMSTNSPTNECWGSIKPIINLPNVIYYSYIRTCEHINVGTFVEFK